MFECLAERTIALAQQVRMKDPKAGFDPLLAQRMRAVLPICAKNKVKIVTNMGAANPAAAAEATREIARKLGLERLKVAAVTGDDVFAYLHATTWRSTTARRSPRSATGHFRQRLYRRRRDRRGLEGRRRRRDHRPRAADPAIFMAPLIVEFGWPMNDWTLLGRGTLVGHLLECAGQVTGGYFADPGVKDIPDLARPGFPIGEVREDGELVVTKVAGSGGAVTARTVKEQLLYEIHDPKAYLQPDVIADFSEVRVEEIGPDRVRVTGGKGGPKTGLLKTSVGYVDSYVGEGQISYAGPNAVARARLALDIVRERLALTGVRTTETRFDLIGVDSLHGEARTRDADPYEVRIRVVGRTDSLAEARRIGEEVETLYTNGPAAGGGAWKSARQVVAVASALIPETAVRTAVTMVEA